MSWDCRSCGTTNSWIRDYCRKCGHSFGFISNVDDEDEGIITKYISQIRKVN